MKVFLTGATGAIGRELLPRLVSGGHKVVAATHRPHKEAGLREAGAQPVAVDGLDRGAVLRAVAAARPDVVVHEMTAIGRLRNPSRLDREFAMTNRLRTEGTRYLIEAAREAGARRFVAQSFAGWPTARTGGRVKAEDDPLDPAPPRGMRRTHGAIRELESLVLGATGLSGIVLRYGGFYGPGTSLALDGYMVEAVRRRQLPVVGNGAGLWSFIHIADAAEATRLAIERAPAGLYNVVDDEPAEVSVWLPELARAVGAKPPRHVPAWLGRLLIGEAGIAMMTQSRGASNAKAKRVLNWQPRYASWRDGFRHGLAAEPAAVPFPRAV